jgi:hypothetical protein
MRQHVVTIIQGDGDVLTVPMNSMMDPVAFSLPAAVDVYIRHALERLPFPAPLVLPLTIHYAEVE